mgnify:FL=1|tara:strand:+ start:1197 stop:1454 length:258 start_codon:yes stop_codon:yes gene_type:complete
MVEYIVLCKSGCGYCEKAIALLEEKEKNFETANFDECLDALKTLQNSFSHFTVPLILKQTKQGDFTLVGGYDSLCDYLDIEHGES